MPYRPTPIEEFDEVDSVGQPTGNRVSRETAHRNGLWHRSVHIWIRDPQHRLLLQLRSDTKESYPGLWDTSCAGHLAAGESTFEAAHRELIEELGLELQDMGRLLFLGEFQGESLLNGGAFIDREWHQVFLLSLGAEECAQLHPDGDEVSALNWWEDRALSEALAREPENFVPHPEEYALLGITPTERAPLVPPP